MYIPLKQTFNQKLNYFSSSFSSFIITTAAGPREALLDGVAEGA